MRMRHPPVERLPGALPHGVGEGEVSRMRDAPWLSSCSRRFQFPVPSASSGSSTGLARRTVAVPSLHRLSPAAPHPLVAPSAAPVCTLPTQRLSPRLHFAATCLPTPESYSCFLNGPEAQSLSTFLKP
jgi:hypothetical protein